VADIDNLKIDIDRLGETLRKSEKEIYEKINNTNSTVGDLNTSVKLVIEKLNSFIDTFKNHDTNEMQKYDDIIDMFKKSQEEIKKLEDKISSKYITKDEMKNFETKLEDNSKAVKQGFKIFYIGTGILITFSVVGGLIMWILNLISELQKLGVN
jgi:uncharacterized coiled-coil DUF342 family protein